MNYKPLPSKERLLELLRYDDGKLYKYIAYKKCWKQAGGFGRSGKNVLSRTIGIDGVRHFEHRVIAAMFGLDVADKQIDHIDGDPLNNRIENLRVVTCSENLRNTKRKSDTFGGVILDKSRNKWMVYVSEAAGFKNLGRFESMLDAIAARMRYNRENGYTSRHGR